MVNPLELVLKGGTPLSPDMAPLWKHLGAGGLAFDAYSVGFGDARRPLKATEVLSRWGANARCQRLVLARDGSDERLRLERARDHWPASARLTFGSNAPSSDEFPGWLDALFGIVGARVGWLEPEGRLDTLFGVETGTGRLIAWGRELRALVPEKKFIAAVKKVGGFVHVGEHALMFGPGRFEQKATKTSLGALRRALWPLVVDAFIARTGVDFEAQVEKVLAPAARRLGFKPARADDAPGVLALRFTRGKFTLHATLSHPLATSWVRVELERPGDTVRLALAEFDAKGFPTLLRAVVAHLEQVPLSAAAR